MKVGDALAVIQRFFLDFIGTVIPGFSLLLGSWFLAGQPLFLGSPLFPPANDLTWILLVVGSYVVGHGVTSIGVGLVQPIAGRVAGWITPPKPAKDEEHTGFKKFRNLLVPNAMRPEKDLAEDIIQSPPYQQFLAKFREAGGLAKPANEETTPKNPVRTVRDGRNVAISIAADEKETIYRFTFLSLLNLGIATVLWLLPVVWGLLHGLHGLGLEFLGTPVAAGWKPAAGAVVLGLLVSLPFLERRFRFYQTTMSVPFAMALEQLTTREQQDGKPSKAPGGQDATPSVFLAGSLRSGWQDHVMGTVTGVRYFDPRAERRRETAAFTVWTLRAIEQSDVVFAHAEKHTPGLYTLSLEVGYAKALGKEIILVDRKLRRHRAFDGVRACAGKTFDALDDGCDYLKALLEPEPSP